MTVAVAPRKVCCCGYGVLQGALLQWEPSKASSRSARKVEWLENEGVCNQDTADKAHGSYRWWHLRSLKLDAALRARAHFLHRFPSLRSAGASLSLEVGVDLQEIRTASL